MGTQFSMVPPATTLQTRCARLEPIFWWSRLRDQLQNDAGGWDRGQDGGVKAERKTGETEPPVLCSDVCASACRLAEQRMKLFLNFVLEIEVNIEA